MSAVLSCGAGRHLTHWLLAFGLSFFLVAPTLAPACAQTGTSQTTPEVPAQPELEDEETSLIIKDAEITITEAEAAIVKLQSPQAKADPSKLFSDIRSVRTRLGKRIVELRALNETKRQSRTSLQQQIQQTQNTIDRLRLAADVDGAVFFRTILDTLENHAKQLEEKKSSGSPEEKIAASAQLREIEAELQQAKLRVREAEQKTQITKTTNTAGMATAEKLRVDFRSRLAALVEDMKAITALSRKADAALATLEDESNRLLQTELHLLSYTAYSTWVFGILVGAVIVGFFIIAFVSTKVRETIFAGDSGIQFVTLFSLVIAIILFGVLKILEGKELAALLGGLSGYILGRGSIPGSRPQTPGQETSTHEPSKPGTPTTPSTPRNPGAPGSPGQPAGPAPGSPAPATAGSGS